MTKPYVQSGEPLHEFLHSFWQRQVDAAEQEIPDYRHPPLPLARIKKVMKSDPDVKMIAADAPILFCKACEIFIAEITARAFIVADSNKRRTLSRADIAKALGKSDQFDFLIDIVPRDEPFVPGVSGPGKNSAKRPVPGAVSVRRDPVRDVRLWAWFLPKRKHTHTHTHTPPLLLGSTQRRRHKMHRNSSKRSSTRLWSVLRSKDPTMNQCTFWVFHRLNFLLPTVVFGILFEYFFWLLEILLSYCLLDPVCQLHVNIRGSCCYQSFVLDDLISNLIMCFAPPGWASLIGSRRRRRPHRHQTNEQNMSIMTICHSLLTAAFICLFLTAFFTTPSVLAYPSPPSSRPLWVASRRTQQPYFPDTPASCPICAQGYPSINSCAQAAPVMANFSSVLFNPGAFLDVIECSCTDTFQSVFPQCVDCFEKTNQTAVLDTPDLPSLVNSIRQVCAFASSILGNVSNSNGETSPSPSPSPSPTTGSAASTTPTTSTSGAPRTWDRFGACSSHLITGAAAVIVFLGASLL